MQFMASRAKVARDARVSDFWGVLMLALLRIERDFWLILPPRRRFCSGSRRRCKGLGPVGEIAIQRAIWERYVLASFLAIVGRLFLRCPPVGGGLGCAAGTSGPGVALPLTP